MSGDFSDERPARKRPHRTDRGPRPVTPTYLRNAALAYLKQRAASRAMLRQTLTRRARLRLQVKSLEPETTQLIENLIEALAADKFVDDATFARGRRTTLQAKGLPRRRIALGLKLKGIEAQTIEATLGDGIDDVVQGRRYAERRRLGPWSRKTVTPDQNRKDLAAMIRAGFSYTVAVKAFGPHDDED